jgi:hypothetical protein
VEYTDADLDMMARKKHHHVYGAPSAQDGKLHFLCKVCGHIRVINLAAQTHLKD